MDDYRLIEGDCLVEMGGIADGSIDLVLTDLPFGATACRWDVLIPFGPLWSHYRRLLKADGVVVLNGTQPFTSMLVMSNPDWFRYSLVWEKTSPTGFLDANRKPLNSHEDICVFSPGQSTYNPQKWSGPANHGLRDKGKSSCAIYGEHRRVESDLSGEKYPRSVLRFPKHSSTENLHPAQKPLALMEWLVLTYSNPGETILDSTMGSGTTGLACLRTGRRFIGIESDPAHFATATLRLSGPPTPLFDAGAEAGPAITQGSLF